MKIKPLLMKDNHGLVYFEPRSHEIIAWECKIHAFEVAIRLFEGILYFTGSEERYIIGRRLCRIK